jgi:serine protease Do
MMIALRIATRYLIAMLLGMCCCRVGIAGAAPLPADLLALAQRSTFEVVLPKVEPDFIRYEKPLPMELLSFRERTDKFWSIGSAFAIAPDIYVSAAHVLLSGMGSPFGQPQLRDMEGRTYPVEQVLKFSLHEDYIVFRARGLTASQVLQPDRDPATGGSVYAAGNALGDGVVLRDGLLTSRTPEDQDGRWKWLRFSAAASPGNSGGPLLDAQGRVLGIITAKSPGENLNYALPIANVLDGKGVAVFDVRSSFGVPILRQQLVANFKDSFPLPAKWDDFARLLMRSSDRQHEVNEKKLLDEHARELPPGGNASRLLATLDRGSELGLIHQQEDDSWDISTPSGEDETKLPGGSTLWTGSLPGAYSFRLERPALVADSAIYRDDTAFMDTLLKGIKLPRMVGTQAIRITSLGQPQSRELHTDRFGRIWQMRTWSLGYSDMLLVTMTLATPDGYAGLLQPVPSASHRVTLAGMKLLADYTHVGYRGSPAQWQALLADRELCPPFLRGIRFGKGLATSLPLHGLDATVPTSLLSIGDESRLLVFPAYMRGEKELRVVLGGASIESLPGKTNSWIGIWSQAQPAEDAGKELTERWRKMSSRAEDFTGEPQHSSDFSTFWTVSVWGEPAQHLLYEVTLSFAEKSLLPRQVSERRDSLLAGMKLKQAAP